MRHHDDFHCVIINYMSAIASVDLGFLDGGFLVEGGEMSEQDGLKFLVEIEVMRGQWADVKMIAAALDGAIAGL